jgi:hypothetical protein
VSPVGASELRGETHLLETNRHELFARNSLTLTAPPDRSHQTSMEILNGL